MLASVEEPETQVISVLKPVRDEQWDNDRARDADWATPTLDVTSEKVFIVDDEALNIRVARKYLRSWGFEHVESTSEALQAITRIHQENPDLILLDVMMPGVSGIDLLRQLRADVRTRHLPVIILTAFVDDELRHTALELGANDFLSKPIDPLEMLPRVRNLLSLRAYQKWLRGTAATLEAEVQRRTAALVASQHDIVRSLAKAAEYRDNDTGRHVIRVGKYAALIARTLGLGQDYVETIEEAAQLHDVGKIGIPDSILLKTGKLDPEEFRAMQEHCDKGMQVICPPTDEDEWSKRYHAQTGASILQTSDTPLMRMASQIALTHHEKWDGSGYPVGLAGERIPLSGRITAVADVFDALSTKRPYKAAFPLEKCYEILREGRGKHFDPQVLDAFMNCLAEVEFIRQKFADAN